MSPASSERRSGRRPRLLHVCAVDYTASRLLAPQLAALQLLGYDVRVACRLTSPVYSSTLTPFRPFDIPFSRSIGPVDLPRALSALRAAVREFRPDLVHLHTPAAAMQARILPRGLLTGAARTAYTVHGFAQVWDRWNRRDRAVNIIERSLARRTDVLLCVSKEDADEAARRNYPTLVRWVGNGVGDDWLAAAAPSPPTGPRTVVFAGRLVREKGVLDLLSAVERVPALHLVIAGESLPSDPDPVESELRRRIAGSADLRARVTMVGMRSPLELQGLIDDAHAVVLPSYREGLPTSVLEAMARSRAVIGTQIRGTRELVVDGTTGWLVRPGRVGELAAGLAKVTSSSSIDLDAMGAEGRRRVLAEYTQADVVARVSDAYAAIGITPG